MPQTNGKEVQELSFQQRAIQPTSGIYRWWFGFPIDTQIGISAWWSPQRDMELRDFWRKPGNDILQGAISSMVKWGTTLPWTLEGPKRTIPKYQSVLNNAEFGQGWAQLITKTLTDYYTQDKGATWELIGAGSPDGMLEGPVVGIAHLDSQFVQPTGDVIYPIIFNNPKDKKPHKIHSSRVVRFVDMVSPNEAMNGIGFSALSRVLSSSDVLLKLATYKVEKLSDMPEAGLLLLNNILPAQWDDATADHAHERRKLGQQIWSNIMTLFSIDPAKPATADFVSFANIPEGFNEAESTNIYVNIVALAFGVDPREFWPMSSGTLGSGRETEVMAQKARGKGKGDVIAMLERAINWFILPENVSFKFDFKDDEEDERRAKINDIKTKTIMSMFVPNAPELPVSTLEIRQMLADNVPDYFKEQFLEVDLTEEEEVTDTESKWKIDNKGLLQSPKRKKRVDNIMEMAVKNFKEGRAELEDIIRLWVGHQADERSDF